MKKRGILLLLLAALCLAACAPAQQTHGVPQPQRVTVEYDIEKVHRIVVIDLTDGTKTVTDHYPDSRIEGVAEFEGTQALRAFLQNTVIPHFEETPDTASDELLRWRIRIVTDDGSLAAFGTAADGFPDYWDDLLTLISD